MATQTLEFYSNSDGSTAALVYDDAAMTASGVLIHVPDGASPVIVNASIEGNPLTLNYGPGTDTTYAFPAAMPLVVITNWKGQPGLQMSWLDYFSVSING